jgi:hypothetical protein
MIGAGVYLCCVAAMAASQSIWLLARCWSARHGGAGRAHGAPINCGFTCHTRVAGCLCSQSGNFYDGGKSMNIRVAGLAVAAAAAAIVLAPTAHANTGNRPLFPVCGMFSLFSEDECAAIKYCLNTDDPACQQAGSQPSTAPPQQRGQ